MSSHSLRVAIWCVVSTRPQFAEDVTSLQPDKPAPKPRPSRILQTAPPSAVATVPSFAEAEMNPLDG